MLAPEINSETEVRKRVTRTFSRLRDTEGRRTVMVRVTGRITDARAEVEVGGGGREVLKRETRNGRKEWRNGANEVGK